MADNRKSRRRRFLGISTLVVVAAVGVILGLGGAGEIVERAMLKTDEIIVERRPDPVYEQLFPYYVAFCATSQYRPKFRSWGGLAGHAAMYIKGACKDDNAPFPQLRRCRSVAIHTRDPEHGAGVSVNRWLRNVNWVAFPGPDLFFKGSVKPGEKITRKHLNATVNDAIAKGVFKGVKFHEFPAGGDLRNFVAHHSIGTDFALQLARSTFCARIPVTAAILDEVIAFLNDKNKEYATGKAEYNWSVWADNCVHTIRNALAAANFWSPVSVRAVKFRQLFNMALPANEFVNLALLGATGPLADYRKIHADDALRDALHEFHWLPTRHGALVKSLPVHKPNDLFDTKFRLFTLQSLIWIGKTRSTVRLLSDNRYVDLGENLRHFKKKYEAILAKHDQKDDALASVRGNSFRRMQRLHYKYIEAQLRDVTSMIDKLAALKAHRKDTNGGKVPSSQ